MKMKTEKEMKGKEGKGMEWNGKNMKTRLRLFSLYFDKNFRHK